MQSEKTCKFQSFTSMGNPRLGPKRLEALQNEISKNGLDGFLIPRSDAYSCLLYTSPSPRDVEESRMPSSA